MHMEIIFIVLKDIIHYSNDDNTQLASSYGDAERFPVSLKTMIILAHMLSCSIF